MGNIQWVIAPGTAEREYTDTQTTTRTPLNKGYLVVIVNIFGYQTMPKTTSEESSKFTVASILSSMANGTQVNTFHLLAFYLMLWWNQ